MRTPKELSPGNRVIYRPELSGCPRCGEPLMLYNYLAWDKTVQTLDRVVSIASRPGHCSSQECPDYPMRLLSAQGQQVAPAGSIYGYDVLARIGWLRQHQRATFEEIWRGLSTQVQISLSHTRYLYRCVYLPLLTCHERQLASRLAQAAQQHGGLIIALDGLAPEGGEPQLWFIRELLTGLTLRSGWLSRQDQATFEAFLRPLCQLEWPILAVLSDKQNGLLPAVATVLPGSRHQLCQAHYLRNLADPLAEADSAFNVALRKAVREQVGVLIRSEHQASASPPGLLTVTGLLPDPLPEAPHPQTTDPLPEAAKEPQTVADKIVTQVLRRTRYLLTLKGRPPLRLAGLEAYRGLQQSLPRTRSGVAAFSQELLTHRYDPRLADLSRGLETALSPFSHDSHRLEQGASWLREIAQILEPPSSGLTTSEQVAGQLRSYLDGLLQQTDLSAQLVAFSRHLDKVSTSYWPGLFHCYDLKELPRTNNDLESRFRDVQSRLLRTTGQKGQTRRALQRTGAWELFPRPLTEAQGLALLRQVSSSELKKEQQRFRQHQQRFRLHTRSARQASAQLGRLRQQWLTLPSTSTG